jgi:hypothetical protein
MKTSRRRYQKGSTTKTPRANGLVWQVRFSEMKDGKRWQKSLTYSGDKYPTEAAVDKAIEHPVSMQNIECQRAKVDALFLCGARTLIAAHDRARWASRAVEFSYWQL